MNNNTDSNTKTTVTEPAPAEGIAYDPGRRYPIIFSPKGFEALSYLSDEEKAIGSETLIRAQTANIEGVEQPPEHMAVQVRNPTLMLNADPELFRRFLDDYDIFGKLVIGMDNDEIMKATDKNGLQTDDPDLRSRYNNSMLMVAKLAQLFDDEWVLRLMATAPGWSDGLSKQQFCLLGQPQSAVWNEEQRLVLEITAAIVNRTVSDALFARAESQWGRKQLLRYASWITYYVGVNMLVQMNISDAEKAGPVKSWFSGE